MFSYLGDSARRRCGQAFWVVLAVLLLGHTAVAAPAFVEKRGARGQAFLFHHNGNCYALLPDHVFRRGPFNIVPAYPAPKAEGQFTPRRFPATEAPGGDFALANVFGLQTSDCGPSWNSLANDLDSELLQGAFGTMGYVRSSGVPDGPGLVVTFVGYENFEARLRGGAQQIGALQGRSGSVFAVNGRPWGLFVDTKTEGNEQVLRFVRFDAIKARLNRHLLSTGATNRRGSTRVASVPTANTLPYQIVSWSALPDDPDNGPTALGRPGGSYIVPADHAPFVVRLAIGQDGQGGNFAGIEIVSDNTTDAGSGGRGSTAPPKRIDLFRARSSDAPFRTRGFSGRLGSDDIGANGRGRIRVSPTYVQWVDVVFMDGWEAGLPIRIDTLAVIDGARD